MLDADAMGELIMYFPAVRAMPDAALGRLRRAGEHFDAAAGEQIWNTGDACLLLTRGTLCVGKQVRGGRILRLYRLRAGQACAWAACAPSSMVLDGMVAEVEQPSAWIAVAPNTLRELLADATALQAFLLEQCAIQFRAVLKRLEGRAIYTMEQRLATVLLDRPDPLTSTHRHLADELFSAREVVSRLLRSFETRGLVRLSRGQVRIVDRAGLQAIAGAM